MPMRLRNAAYVGRYAMKQPRPHTQSTQPAEPARRRLAAVPARSESRGLRGRVRAHMLEWWPIWVAAVASRIGIIVVGLLSEYAARSRGVNDVVAFSRSGTFVHYQDVVLRGYTAANAYEFPLFPALLGIAHSLGMRLDVASMLVANACFIVGIVGMAMLGRRYVGREAAIAGATLLVLWPTSHFFSIASTESLMLAASVWAVIFALRASPANWCAAGVCAAACALSRPPGALIGVVLLAIAVSQLRSGQLRGPRAIGAAIAAGAAIPMAVLAFFWYLREVTGNFQAALDAQQQFGRSMTLDGPVRALSSAMDSIAAGSLGPAFEIAAIGLIIAMLTVFAARANGARIERWGWVAFGVLSLLMPLSSGLVWQMPRFAMLMLPVFWAMGIVANRWKWVQSGLLILLPMALAFKVTFDVVGVTQ